MKQVQTPWGQRVLRVEYEVTAQYNQDVGFERALEERLYWQLDKQLGEMLRVGDAYVVQYGKLQEEPASWRDPYYRPSKRYFIDAVLIPVVVQKGQQVYRALQWDMSEAVHWPTVTASDVSKGETVYDDRLNGIADDRTYVGLTVDGNVRFFERTRSGWKRLW